MFRRQLFSLSTKSINKRVSVSETRATETDPLDVVSYRRCASTVEHRVVSKREGARERESQESTMNGGFQLICCRLVAVLSDFGGHTRPHSHMLGASLSATPSAISRSVLVCVHCVCLLLLLHFSMRMRRKLLNASRWLRSAERVCHAHARWNVRRLRAASRL